MVRPILFLALLTLVLGCKKRNPEESQPGKTPDNPASVNTPAPTDIPKLQAKAKFKLPNKRHSNSTGRLSDDGKILAVAHHTPQFNVPVQIWDIAGPPKVIAEIESHGSAYAISPSGKLLATFGQVFEIATKKPLAKWADGGSHTFFRDENTVVTTLRSYDFAKATKGRITIWDVAKNADAGSFDIPDNRFSHVFITNNGKELWLFLGHNKFEVECYDLHTKQLLRTVKPENDTPTSPYTGPDIWCSVASDGSAFVSAAHKGHFYDGVTGKLLPNPPTTHWINQTGFVPGGHRYVAKNFEAGKALGLGSHDSVLYDWKDRKWLAWITGHPATESGVAGVGSADGKTYVSLGESGECLVFDISGVK